MREALVRAIEQQRAAILGAIAGVEGEAWAAPTVCTDWSAKDVLSHMVEGELNVGRVYRGEQRAPGRIDPQEGVERWRALPGVAVRAAFWQHGTATQRVLDSMGDETWRAPIDAFGCREIRQLVRLHLFDLSIHGHDLTDALGLEPVWAPQLPFVAEYVVRAAPPTLTRLGIAPRGTLALRLPDAGWLIDGSGDAWTLRRLDDATDATATLEPDPGDLVLATTGRAPVEAVVARAGVEGDTAYASEILAGWQVLRR